MTCNFSAIEQTLENHNTNNDSNQPEAKEHVGFVVGGGGERHRQDQRLFNGEASLRSVNNFTQKASGNKNTLGMGIPWKKHEKTWQHPGSILAAKEPRSLVTTQSVPTLLVEGRDFTEPKGRGWG